MKKMSEQEMMSEIIRIEMILIKSIFEGHKASTDDVYQPLREKIKHYREKLEIR